MSHPNSYYEGRTSRRRGIEKTSNPFQSMTASWSWWMAGWNDADIEDSNEDKFNY